MSTAMPGILGYGPTKARTAVNATRNYITAAGGAAAAALYPYGVPIKRGTPCCFYPNVGSTDGPADVIPCIFPFHMGAFAGVVGETELAANVLGDQISNLVYEGVVRANLWIPTSGRSSCVKGAALMPYGTGFSSSEFGFKVVGYETGIVLAEDISTNTAYTENALNTVDSGQSVLIEIRPGAMRGLMILIDAATADADYYLAAQATSASATTTKVAADLLANAVTDPRAVSITPGGTTADVPAGDVTITGYDGFGIAISDTITFAANASTVGYTTKAFAKIATIVFPIQDGAAATYDVGFGLKFQLPQCFNGPPYQIDMRKDTTKETTLGTIATDLDEPSKNTVQWQTTPNSSLDMQLAWRP